MLLSACSEGRFKLLPSITKFRKIQYYRTYPKELTVKEEAHTRITQLDKHIESVMNDVKLISYFSILFTYGLLSKFLYLYIIYLFMFTE